MDRENETLDEKLWLMHVRMCALCWQLQKHFYLMPWTSAVVLPDTRTQGLMCKISFKDSGQNLDDHLLF